MVRDDQELPQASAVSQLPEALPVPARQDNRSGLSIAPPTPYTWFVRLLPLLVGGLGWGCALFFTGLLHQYGVALFCLLPVCVGALGVSLHNWHEDVTPTRALWLANR